MKLDVQHPTVFLPREITQSLRDLGREAEDLKVLHPAQLEIIYRYHYFKMLVPRAFGGLGLTLPEVLMTEESLSWADGSTGWVVTLCSGAGWFVGFLDPDVRRELFADGRVCLAGSGALTGVAEVTSNGYVITGFWKYASGAMHATAFTVNCLLRQHGQQIHNADGTAASLSFILKREEVTVDQSWNAMGMVATGSHSFGVNKLHVSSSRSFSIQATRTTLPDPIYQYPFLQLAETTLAVNILGMTMRFLDLAEEILSRKTEGHEFKNSIASLVSERRHAFMELRRSFYTSVMKSWEILMQQNHISGELLGEVSEISHRCVTSARDLVNVIYPYCGLSAAAITHEINRVWRNIHTAGQHSLFVRP